MNVSVMGEARKFPLEEIDTLDAIARQAAVIIENVRLYEREQRQHQRREALTNVLTAASSTLDLREVLAKICEAALELTVGDEVSIFLVDESGEATPMMAASRSDKDALTKLLSTPPEVLKAPEAQRLSRVLIQRRKPVIVRDTTKTPFLNRWWRGALRRQVSRLLSAGGKRQTCRRHGSERDTGAQRFPAGGDRDAVRGCEAGGGDHRKRPPLRAAAGATQARRSPGGRPDGGALRR